MSATNTKKPASKPRKNSKTSRTKKTVKHIDQHSINSRLSIRQRLSQRRQKFLQRRVHRSFRITHRRDYARSLSLPNMVKFTRYVISRLWLQKRSFLYLGAVYTILAIVFATVVSQQSYTSASETISSTFGDSFSGAFGQITQAGLIVASIVNGSLSGSSSSEQQIFSIIIGLFIWLTTVWLLRAALAGSDVRLRDALYNSGSPIIATMLVFLIFVAQLLPAVIGIIGYQALAAAGLVNSGVLAMVVTLAAILLSVLSLYLVTSTVFALVIVTLPGMYPMRAIKAAGDLVAGRRLRILLRLLWLVLIVVIGWVIVTIPYVLGINFLQSKISWLNTIPIVPVSIVILTTFTTVFVSAYIYLLYRKIVDDESKPA